MKPPHHYDLMMMNMDCVFKDYEDTEALSEAYTELYEATEILNQAYKKVTPIECTNNQHHISN